MLHARADYACIQPWPTKREHTARDETGRVHHGDADEGMAPIIPDDEPVLLLRAQDVCAPAALDFYAEQLMGSGADKELVDAVRRHAQAMRDWQRERKTKVPDADKAFL